MITGLIVGAISFLIIGIFHPIVIKAEYYFSCRIWPLFLVIGIVLCGVSLIIDTVIISSSFAITGFSTLWCIKELKEQEERVRKGWFPSNPKRVLALERLVKNEINVQGTIKRS